MHKIYHLDAHEALKIAAGEVVERPADMLKELLENAIDAKARSISVFTENAGQTLLRVIDDGCGMVYQDALLCVQRYATSKIRTIDDLATLTSFGFRGEGLASIAAVTKLELITKTAHCPVATSLYFEQGILKNDIQVASNTGTDISVRDLFYALPARKKFLRKQETEWRMLVQLFQAFCLSHPRIHFKLFAENKLVHNCPPAQSLQDRSAQLWDASLAAQLSIVKSTENPKVLLTGVVSTPIIQRYNRQQIFIFVNQRWIKNTKLTQALIKAYAGSLQPERYPVAVLLLEVPPDEVDINVHPRKEEVTFLYPKLIEQVITKTTHECLQKTIKSHIYPREPNKEPFTNFHTAKQHETYVLHRYDTPFKPSASLAQFSPFEPSSSFRIPAQSIQPSLETTERLPEDTQLPLATDSPTAQPLEATPTMIGILRDTYILLEHPDGLLLVDQHAVHERILYELFTKRFATVSSIELLFKPTLAFEPSEILLLEKYQELFSTYHIIFEIIEDVGIRINATPIHLKQVNWQEFFAEMIAAFKEEITTNPENIAQRLHHALCAQMACKAAIKAGDVLSTTEVNKLLDDLAACPERLCCPHGRPISWLLPHTTILKNFRRTS